MSKPGRERQRPPDAFDSAMAMLSRPRCPTCVGRGWYLGFWGRLVCNICGGRGVR